MLFLIQLHSLYHLVMDKEDENRLRKNAVYLTENLSLNDVFLNYLHEHKIMSRGKYEEFIVS